MNPSATIEVQSLLEHILDYHGKLSRWHGLENLTVRLRFGGLAFRTRFNCNGLHDRRIQIYTREPKVIFNAYPDPEQRGIFTPNRVWITSTNGTVLGVRDAPRQTFASFRKSLWWDDLDLLYFAGYAVWNYLSMPFLLARPEVIIKTLPPWEEAGVSWHRIAAYFPPSLPTHNPYQVFYFDSDLRLCRHDYNPEVFASWARAAHYCSAYKTFDGFQFPTRRKVVPRGLDNRSKPGPKLVWIEIFDITTHKASTA